MISLKDAAHRDFWRQTINQIVSIMPWHTKNPVKLLETRKDNLADASMDASMGNRFDSKANDTR